MSESATQVHTGQTFMLHAKQSRLHCCEFARVRATSYCSTSQQPNKREHSRHTICNKVLMKGEHGRLPASLSALQSAHVIGGRVGSTAASSSSSSHTHSLTPQKTLHIPLQLCYKPQVTLQHLRVTLA